MATPLTDGINALTQYANEVTGKQDTTLSDAVGSLVEGYGGGGDVWSNYIGTLSNHFAYAQFDENQDIVLDCSNVVFTSAGDTNVNIPLDGMFQNARRMKSIKLIGLKRNSNNTTTFNNFVLKDGYYSAFSENLEVVSIPDMELYCSTSISAFEGRTHLKVVDILFNMSKISNYNSGYNFRRMFQGCSALEEVRFVPNTILWMNYQIFNVSQVLSDASLVSIANGLYEGATQYNSLALLSTPKARCSTLMGNNVDGLFVADENGTLTLADFITTIKGWTLA